jgi:signal transduction histidine kinase
VSPDLRNRNEPVDELRWVNDDETSSMNIAEDVEARFEWIRAHGVQVMESTNQSLIVMDGEGFVKYANPAAARLMKTLTPSDLIGRNMHKIVHPRCGRNGMCLLLSPFLTALTHTNVDDVWRVGDRDVPVTVTVGPALEQGVVTSVAVLAADATQQYEDHLLRERTRRALESALTQAKELDEHKTDFIYTVSHELRTPLTSILGYTEIALESDVTQRDEDLLDTLLTVERNAQRLLAQVEALLLVARIEGGKIKSQKSALLVGELISAAVSAVAMTAERKNVTIHVECDDKLLVYSDPGQTDQVLLNLMSNAVKFTPGGGEIYVSARGSQNWVQFDVEDTGIGIPEKEQPLMFQKFFRSTVSRKGATPGTGLGLTITKAIIEEHGGQIVFMSEEGKGTVFAFTLPSVTQAPTVIAKKPTNRGR